MTYLKGPFASFGEYVPASCRKALLACTPQFSSSSGNLLELYFALCRNVYRTCGHSPIAPSLFSTLTFPVFLCISELNRNRWKFTVLLFGYFSVQLRATQLCGIFASSVRRTNHVLPHGEVGTVLLIKGGMAANCSTVMSHMTTHKFRVVHHLMDVVEELGGHLISKYIRYLRGKLHRNSIDLPIMVGYFSKKACFLCAGQLCCLVEPHLTGCQNDSTISLNHKVQAIIKTLCSSVPVVEKKGKSFYYNGRPTICRRKKTIPHVVLDTILLKVLRCLGPVELTGGIDVCPFKVFPINLELVFWVGAQVDVGFPHTHH